MADDPKTTMTPDKGRPSDADLADKGKTAEGWGDKGAPEKPQDEVAPGPGADGALPKTA